MTTNPAVSNGVPLSVRCHHCGKIWNYTGARKFYATCPDCRHNVRLDRSNGASDTISELISGMSREELHRLMKLGGDQDGRIEE
jgi:hypothetical protein